MPTDELRELAEMESAEARIIQSAVEKIDDGLGALTDRFVRLVEDRDAHRFRANRMMREHRDAVGKAGRLEAVLTQIATNARLSTDAFELKKIAQVAERAIAEERKRE